MTARRGKFIILWYRAYRRLLFRYKFASFYYFRTRYRFYRRLWHYAASATSYALNTRYRLLRRLRFRYLRVLIFFIFRLWLGDVKGFEKIPQHESALIVSNHLSFFDFWILSAILKRNTSFVAVKNLDKRGVVGWTMRLNPIIYVDREKPGASFFKRALKELMEQSRHIVIYPEGTRSRSGKMLPPKPGFIKLAMRAGVPIIPISMIGTYEILPPHKKVPRLKKCDVVIGDKYYVSPNNPELYDIFFRKAGTERRFKDLGDDEMLEIAFRIMDKVRITAGEEWDETAVRPKLDIPADIRERKKELLAQQL